MQHDDDITSSELDGLLDNAETLSSPQPTGGTAVRLSVTVDAATLHHLEQRAEAEGTDVTAVAADALRAATQAA
jgi:hypothetical protein